MKNIVVKFKTGQVGMAHNLTGEMATHKFEQNELGFPIGKHTPDTGIPNVFWALDSIMKEVGEFIEKNPTERVQIAVPGTVWAVANSIEMLTKLMWTKKMVYSTLKDQKSHRTILLHRKKAEQYMLSEPEWVAYKSLFANMKKYMGYVLFVDSQFIASNPENAKTADQIAWLEVNQVCSQLMDISSGGAVSPYANVATGTDDIPAPPMGENDDLPF